MLRRLCTFALATAVVLAVIGGGCPNFRGLTGSDTDGGWDVINEVAQALNRPPVIDSFTAEPATIEVGQTVTFSWSVSDPDGERVSVALSIDDQRRTDFFFDDGAATTSQSYTYRNAGPVAPELRVYDGKADARSRVSVTVNGPIRITVVRPHGGARSDDDLVVEVGVTSQFELAGVTARVEDRVVELGKRPDYPWSGGLSLAGLPPGEKRLTATARDVLGNEAEHPRVFTYDQRPRVQILEPLPDSVARPRIRIHAICTDDNPGGCVNVDIRLARYYPPYSSQLASFTSSFEGELDLSPAGIGGVELSFSATDGAQGGGSTVPVWVEPSQALTPVAAAPGMILHAAADRLVYGLEQVGHPIPEGTWQALGVLNRADGSTQLAPLPGGLRVHQAHAALVSTGVVFVADPNGHLYEWNAAGVTDLASAVPRVAGNYGVWTQWFAEFNEFGLVWSEYRTFLRDFSLGATTELTNQATAEADVATTGMAVFGVGGQLYVYEAGARRQITSDARYRHDAPRTDGARIVYATTTVADYKPHELILYDGATEIVLTDSSASGYLPPPDTGYQVANGWVAFWRPGTVGGPHVWLRNPQGEERQLTFFSAGAQIERLAPNGEVMLLAENRRYLADFAGQLRDICSSNGKSWWIDDGWYVSIGRELFRVTP